MGGFCRSIYRDVPMENLNRMFSYIGKFMSH